MPTFIYRCPNTGYLIQGVTAEDFSEDGERYLPVTCDLCRRVHLVKPATGEILGSTSDQRITPD
jgi:hypothetical protein